jgi:hypothetical protein
MKSAHRDVTMWRYGQMQTTAPSDRSLPRGHRAQQSLIIDTPPRIAVENSYAICVFTHMYRDGDDNITRAHFGKVMRSASARPRNCSTPGIEVHPPLMRACLCMTAVQTSISRTL